MRSVVSSFPARSIVNILEAVAANHKIIYDEAIGPAYQNVRTRWVVRNTAAKFVSAMGYIRIYSECPLAW